MMDPTIAKWESRATRKHWIRSLSLGLPTTILVATFVLVGLQTVSEGLHLSIIASAEDNTGWRVTKVQPGGLGYDAGIREGQLVTAYQGGMIEEDGGQVVLHNPVTVELITSDSVEPRRVNAYDVYLPKKTGAALLGLLSLVFLAAGLLVLFARPWEPITAWAFAFFAAVAISLSVGISSGVLGGIYTSATEVTVVLATCVSLVGFVQVLSRYYYRPTWLQVTVLAVGIGVWGLCVVGVLAMTKIYPLARLALGLYLTLSLALAIGYGLWTYRRNDSRIIRTQLRILGTSTVLGLGLCFGLLLMPRLTFGMVGFVPAEVVIAGLALMPIGWAYALLYSDLRDPRGLAQKSLVVFTATFGSFVAVAALASLVIRVDATEPLGQAVWVVIAGGLVAGGLLFGFILASQLCGFLDVRDLTGTTLPGGDRTLSLGTASLAQVSPSLVREVGVLAEQAERLQEATKLLVLNLGQLRLAGGLLKISRQNWYPGLVKFAQEIESQWTIAIHTTTIGQPPDIVPDEVAKRLYYVGIGSLHNLVRISNATECMVAAVVVRDEAMLIIKDNRSRSESLDEASGTDGLISSMRAVMAEVGGSLTIHSNPTHSTTVLASVAW